MDDFLALNKLRGFTPRQRRLLELESVYLGTQYKGLPHWSEDYGPDPVSGLNRQLRGDEKEPTLKAGVIEEKVGRLISLLVGEGRFPTLKVPDDFADTLRQLTLNESVRGPTRDIIVKGSGALGFVVLDGNRVEALQLRPEWCEPIFVSKVGRPRAGQIADELAAAGVSLRAPRSSRESLWTPDGAESHDLAFLRYEYVYHEEQAVTDGASQSTNVAWRVRTDYTPDAIIEYEDVRVYGETEKAAAWVVAEIIEHKWGVVPVVWARALDAEQGEPEGPSLIGESLRTLAEAADRMLTRKDDSAAVIASPKPYTINLQDLVADVNTDSGQPAGWLARSGEVLMFQSAGTKAGAIGLLEPTGKGPEVAKAHLDDLLAHAQRVSGVIAHDPQQSAGVQSGVALERMMEPTIARVNDYRVPVAAMLVTLIRKLSIAMGKAPITAQVQWPPVIALTAADQLALAQALTTATGGPVLSQETGVRMFAAHAEIDDPEAEVALVQAGVEQAMAQARDALATAQETTPAVP